MANENAGLIEEARELAEHPRPDIPLAARTMIHRLLAALESCERERAAARQEGFADGHAEGSGVVPRSGDFL